MSNMILVNNVEIEKSVVYDFLIQDRKLEAVKFIMERAGIGMSSAKEIVEMIQDKSIENFKNKDVFNEITNNTEQFQLNSKQSESINKQKPKRRILKRVFIVFGILGLGVFLFLKYCIGFQHVATHWRDLQSVLFDNQNTSVAAEGAQVASTIDVAQVQLESPIDTLMWMQWNKKDIPKDVLEEIERYKKRDFSKLVVAKDVPTDKETEEAIVHRYKDEVVSLLQRENAHIKIGTCYNAPLQKSDDGDVEIARVTAMVSAFNKARGNLGNIQQPLGAIYDFVKFQSDPKTWYITDFSQNIPYDYKLNKDR